MSATSPVRGIAVAAVGAAAGYGVHALFPVIPWLTAALIIGVIVGSIPALRTRLDGDLKPGLAISSRRLLRLGIVLLGLKLSLGQIADLGWFTILAIVVLVLLSFAVTWGIGKAFGLKGDEPLLLAAGFSICGVSAIGAMSAARGSSSSEAAKPITLVTLYGTAAIVVLPALAPLFGLTPTQYGQWVGASVHDVGQVVATAQSAGVAALAVAVVIKLTRVLMLAPMVAVTAVITRQRGTSTSAKPAIVPLFIVGFVVLVLVRTFIPLPDAVLIGADILQSIFLAMALFAIGASLRLEQLAKSGLPALGAGLVSWAAILGLALGFVALSS